MGRLVADPELKHTPSDIAVTRFTIAVNRNYGKTAEERKTDFIDVVAWRGTAEFICKYFKKGQQVGVIGRLQTRTWDDDKGQKHYITEVIVEETYFADSRRDGAAADMDSSFGADASIPAGNGSEFEVSSGDDLPF